MRAKRRHGGVPPSGVPPSGVPPSGVPPSGVPPSGVPPSRSCNPMANGHGTNAL
jgi:hypothetical protein